MVNIPAGFAPRGGGGGKKKLFFPKSEKQGKNKENLLPKIPKNTLFLVVFRFFISKMYKILLFFTKYHLNRVHLHELHYF